MEIFATIRLRRANPLATVYLNILGCQLSDRGFCQYHLMTKSNISDLVVECRQFCLVIFSINLMHIFFNDSHKVNLYYDILRVSIESTIFVYLTAMNLFLIAIF